MNENSEPNGPSDAALSTQELKDFMAARTALGTRLSKVLKVGMVVSIIFMPICAVYLMLFGYHDEKSISGALRGGLGGAFAGLWQGPLWAALYWGFVMWGRRERLHMEFVDEHRRRGYSWAMPAFYDYEGERNRSLLVLGIEIAISPFTFLIYLSRW